VKGAVVCRLRHCGLLAEAGREAFAVVAKFLGCRPLAALFDDERLRQDAEGGAMERAHRLWPPPRARDPPCGNLKEAEWPPLVDPGAGRMLSKGRCSQGCGNRQAVVIDAEAANAVAVIGTPQAALTCGRNRRAPTSGSTSTCGHAATPAYAWNPHWERMISFGTVGSEVPGFIAL